MDIPGNVKEPFKFLIVNSPIQTASARGSSDRLFAIPMTWISDDQFSFLHPPLDVKVGGMYLLNWSSITFKKRFPESSWTKLPISDVLTEDNCPSITYI